MTITYPLSLPNVAHLADAGLMDRTVTAVTKSPYTGEEQIQEYPGQWWELDFNLIPLSLADAAAWEAFFSKLKGKRGTFLFQDPSYTGPRGSAGVTPGTPAVMGAGQTGEDLVIDGCPNSATNYFLAGDMIQLGTGASSRLHRVLNNTNTNGSGQATLTLFPRIITAPADNDLLTLTNPKGVFRLDMNGVRSSKLAGGLVGFPTISALESL